MTDVQSNQEPQETVSPKNGQGPWSSAFENPDAAVVRMAAEIQRAAEQVPPRTVTTTARTTAIGTAIRDEIRKLLEQDLDLERLAAIHAVARDGRALLAIRSPLARFDAKAQGLGPGPTMGGNSGSAIINSQMMGGLYECTNPYAIGGWNGPAVFGAKEAMERQIQTALADSPLAKAVKTELLEMVGTEVFGATELLQIEQMAAQSHRVLAAALGLPVHDPPPQVRRRNFPGVYGSNPFTNPSSLVDEMETDEDCMAPSTSQETYGAKISRELVAATGKLTDMLGRLEARLGSEKKDPG